MNKKIKIANDICYILMKILLLTAAYLFFQSMLMQGNLLYPGVLLIVIIIFVDYLLKVFSKNYVFYLVGHIIFIPIILFLNFSSVEEVGLMGVTILSSIGSIHFWKTEVNTQRQEQLNIPLSAVILFILVELISDSLGYSTLFRLTFYMGLGFIILYFTRTYLTSMLNFFMSNADVKHVPFHRIFILNSGLNLLILLSSLLLLVFTYITNMGRLVNVIGSKLGLLVIRLFMMFQPKSNEPQSHIIREEPIPPQEIDLDGLGNAQKFNPIVGFIMDFIVRALFIGLIILAIYLLFLYLKTYLKRYRPKSDVIEFREAITKAEYVKKEPKKKLSSFFAFMTNNQRIRKIYYKRVKYYQKSLVEITPRDTPGEIEQKVMNKTKDSIHTLTSIYEQARYGDKELSSEDVNQAKSSRD